MESLFVFTKSLYENICIGPKLDTITDSWNFTKLHTTRGVTELVTLNSSIALAEHAHHSLITNIEPISRWINKDERLKD